MVTRWRGGMSCFRILIHAARLNTRSLLAPFDLIASLDCWLSGVGGTLRASTDRHQGIS